jgi:IclR family pca regulon transcriptional regulator
MRVSAKEFERLGIDPLLNAAALLSRALQALGGATFSISQPH